MLSYARGTWGHSSERAQEILDYVKNKILTNDTWVAAEQQNAIDRDRTFEIQLMHAANWQLHRKDGCKYCDEKVEEVEETPTPTPTTTPNPQVVLVKLMGDKIQTRLIM